MNTKSFNFVRPHDYQLFIKLNMHILIKCYLERFASINDPEN